MPALVAGIHVSSVSKQDVDGQDKPGHDGERAPRMTQQQRKTEQYAFAIAPYKPYPLAAP